MAPILPTGRDGDASDRGNGLIGWPNTIFATLFVAFFLNILHLYETEENTFKILCWSPLPIGIAGTVAFVAALVQNIKRNRTAMALVVIPFGLFLFTYMWSMLGPIFS